MSMMEFQTILLPTVITLMSLLLLGWQYRRQEERKIAAIRIMKLNRFGATAGSRNLDVFLPSRYPELNQERYHLMVLNDGRLEHVSMLETSKHLETAADFDLAIESIPAIKEIQAIKEIAWKKHDEEQAREGT